MNGWIGVDLDGTLATYAGWSGGTVIGLPVPRMVTRVKQWLAEGKDVRIFTARVYGLNSQNPRIYSEAWKQARAIEAWCLEHIGAKLPVTNEKDYAMTELWDDRAVQVVPNTGETVAEHARKCRGFGCLCAEAS